MLTPRNDEYKAVLTTEFCAKALELFNNNKIRPVVDQVFPLFGLMAAIFYSLTAWLAPAIQSQGYTKETAGSIQTLFTLISLPSTLFIPTTVTKDAYSGLLDVRSWS